MNNKGFMMAEVVVVSAIILITMSTLYASYNKILAAYNQRVNYYDVTTLYELANFRDTKLGGYNHSITTDLLSDNMKAIYYVDKKVIKNNTLNVTNQTFKDYLKYLSTSLDFDNLKKANGSSVEYLLVMERCITQDNCKYAYLEVLN